MRYEAEKGGLKVLLPFPVWGSESVWPNEEKVVVVVVVEEAEPDQGVEHGEFVSCWSRTDREKKTAGSLPFGQSLSLPVPPFWSPLL